MRIARIAGMIALLVAMTACDAETGDEKNGLRVVATTSIIGDMTASVVGDEGTVEILIPPGVDSHEFQPSAQQASVIASADLVVANGLGLEQGLRDLLTTAAGDGIPVLELAPLLAPIPLGAGGEDEAEPGRDDPHFWMDPMRVGGAAIAIAEELATIRSGGWADRARQYEEEMASTDASILDVLDRVPETSRKMVTNHDAFGYFADRYGFEIVGVVIPGGSTLAEPSSAELADLVGVIEEEGVRVIFAETTQPTTLAEAIASEVGDGVEVVELYTESLGPAGSEAASLSGMLLANARRIADALG